MSTDNKPTAPQIETPGSDIDTASSQTHDQCCQARSVKGNRNNPDARVQEHYHNYAHKHWLDYTTTALTLFAVAIAAGSAFFSAKQVSLSARQVSTAAASLQISRESYTAVQRAFVSVIGFTAQPYKDKGVLLGYFVFPEIVNNGNTRTSGFSYSEITDAWPIIPDQWRTVEAPMRYDNIDRPQDPDDLWNSIPQSRVRLVLTQDADKAAIQHAMPGRWILKTLEPRQTAFIWPSSGLRIEDLKKVLARTGHVAALGTIHYHDVFDGTPEHETKFCFIIEASEDGNGDIVPKDGGLCAHWNCADRGNKEDGSAYLNDIAKERARIDASVASATDKHGRTRSPTVNELPPPTAIP